MKTSEENALLQWDLYKSYGEFNFLFEDAVHEYRLLIIALVRISYEYFEEEDEEEELEYHEQDRLMKILMNSMGAKDLVENCRACYIDFFNRQKQKYGNFTFKWFDEEHTFTQATYEFALATFKKSLELIQLRNIIIHSHYSESLIPSEFHKGNLKGQKDVKSGKGYENRNYTLDINYFEKINNHIIELQSNLFTIRYYFTLSEEQKNDYHEELNKLKLMDFNVETTTL